MLFLRQQKSSKAAPAAAQIRSCATCRRAPTSLLQIQGHLWGSFLPSWSPAWLMPRYGLRHIMLVVAILVHVDKWLRCNLFGQRACAHASMCTGRQRKHGPSTVGCLHLQIWPKSLTTQPTTLLHCPPLFGCVHACVVRTCRWLVRWRRQQWPH